MDFLLRLFSVWGLWKFKFKLSSLAVVTRGVIETTSRPSVRLPTAATETLSSLFSALPMSTEPRLRSAQTPHLRHFERFQ